MARHAALVHGIGLWGMVGRRVAIATSGTAVVAAKTVRREQPPEARRQGQAERGRLLPPLEQPPVWSARPTGLPRRSREPRSRAGGLVSWGERVGSPSVAAPGERRRAEGGGLAEDPNLSVPRHEQASRRPTGGGGLAEALTIESDPEVKVVEAAQLDLRVVGEAESADLRGAPHE